MYALGTPRTAAVRASEVHVCAWLDASALTEVRRLLESVPPRSSGNENICAPRISHSRSIVWHEVSDFMHLRTARNAGISRLLIGPGLLSVGHPLDSRKRNVLARAFRQWRGARVVLIAHPVSLMLHEVHAFASAVPSSLVLLGVDEVEALERALCFDEPDEPFSVGTLLHTAEQWPRLLRDAVSTALAAPYHWPVKKVAATAGLSTRTIERYFAAAGLPSPSAALSSARACQDEFNESAVR